MKSYDEIIPDVDALFARFDTTRPDKNIATSGEIYSSWRIREGNEPGASSGWGSFDRSMNGLRLNEFTVFCGPTGAGKTMFLANLAANILRNEALVCHSVPVEIGARDFFGKVVCILSGKHPSKIEDADVEKVKTHFGEKLLGSKFIFSTYETRVSHRQLICDIYNSHFTYGSNLFLIDNLNFMMEVVGAKEAVSEMDRVVHDLIVLCKLLPIHIVMVMHPKKTDGGRVESEFDIKGSSTAVQEASNVILWNRLAPETQLSLTEEPFRQMYREMKFCKIRKHGHMVGQKIYFRCDVSSEVLREVKL